MFTIFTSCRNSIKWPKYGILQYNAIKSWSLINPKPQILIMGDDPGVKELCEELQVTHIKDIETEQDDSSNKGVPIFSSMVKIAEEMARPDDTMLCMSSDIIIFQNIIKARQALINKFENGFCGVVQRSNKKIIEKIDFENKKWADEVLAGCQLHNPCSGDIFMFSKGFWENEMPPFMIGRSRVDTWMFWYGSEKKLLVDMTKAIKIVHQLHEKFETNNDRKLDSEYYKKNTELAKGNCYGKGINIRNANWAMDSSFNIKEK